MSGDLVGRCTVFTSSGVSLAKQYRLDSEGKLVKRASANMTSGSFEVREFATIRDLAQLIDGLDTQQAICASLPNDGSGSGRIVCQRALHANPGAISRSKLHFGLPAGRGLLFLDHDSATADVALSRDDLRSLLLNVAPAFAEAGVMWRPSGSSHVFHGDLDLTGLRGQHIFALLADASDAPRVVRTIAARMWLLGYGRIELSSSGAMLPRCPIDTAPSDAARFIFAAGADCASSGLEQRRGPAVVLSEGGFLDSRRLVPDLTRAEQDKYDAAVESAKSAKLPEALAVRATHRAATIARRMPAMLAAGMGAAEAEARIGRAVDACYGAVLLGDFELMAVHDDGRHETVTVAEVLRDRERWNEVDVLVPGNEGHRSGGPGGLGSPDARLYLLGGSPIIYSLDGPQVFRLRQQEVVVRTTKGQRGELVETLCKVISEQDDVFATDAGPVLIIDGRVVPLNTQRLQNLVGSRVALMTRDKNRDMPTDLTREVAELVLSSLADAR